MKIAIIATLAAAAAFAQQTVYIQTTAPVSIMCKQTDGTLAACPAAGGTTGGGGTTTGGGTTVVTAGSSRSVAGCPLGLTTMYYNNRVDLLPLDLQSAAKIAGLPAGRLGPSPEFWLNIADAAAPGASITWDVDSLEFDGGAYPITPAMYISAYPRVLISAAGSGDLYPNMDAHVLALRPAPSCMLYEAYALQSNSSPFHIGNGTIWDLNDDRLRSAYKPFAQQMLDSSGISSADAAGMPIYPLTLTHAEVFGGQPIVHGMRFALNSADVQHGYKWPAVHAAGGTADSPGPDNPKLKFSGAAIVLGDTFRLRPDFPLDVCWNADNKGQAYPGWFVQVLKAMQGYGLYFTDNTGTRGLVGTDSDPAWGDSGLPTSDNWIFAGWLHCVQLTDLQIVDNGPRIISPFSGSVRSFAPR